jgi:phosphatidylserine synthase
VAIALLGAGTAYRLALFNTLPPAPIFRGLPSPASGLFFAGWIFSVTYGGDWIPELHKNEFLYLALPLFFATLMNIRSPFFSMKSYEAGWPQGIPHYLLFLGLVLIFIFLPYDAAALSILWYILLALLFYPMVRKYSFSED